MMGYRPNHPCSFQMEEIDVNANNGHPDTNLPDSQEPVAPKPETKTWQDTAKQFLTNLAAWFMKLKIIYKIILIIVVAAILVLLLLAYLGVFGQQVADLMKQLVNKILELVGSKKS